MAEVDATRACRVCGTEFKRHFKRETCSEECRAERQRQREHKCRVKHGRQREKVEKTCAGCGNTFATARACQTHCGTACRQSVKVAPYARDCVVCGVTFLGKHGKAVCSIACAAIRQREYEARSNARKPAVVKQAKQCKWCAAEFTPARGTGYLYCCGEHQRLAKLRRDNARTVTLEQRAARNSAYRAKHHDLIRRGDNAYKARVRADGNRDRTPDRVRRQRMKLVCGSLSQSDVAAIKAERCDCLYCGSPLDDADKVMDHMDPLSKGGAHDRSNIVVCCAKCNSSKSAKQFADWLLIVPASRRKMVARVYEKKRGATFEQPSLFGAAIAA